MATPENPAVPQQPTNGDEPPVSADFFQGGVEQGLKRMRTRLLDLSSRNRLLNFRHTKKSSLRVVDELPDALFSALRNSVSLTFAPVTRPFPIAEPEEDNAIAELPSDAPKTPQQRVPAAAQWAEQQGIATSFDLPNAVGNGDAEPRHSDRLIQTLHYPEDLEAILRSIAGAARLAIEETGTNMLYLAFGFLEWYESDDSTQVRTAPLVLLPVSLERGDPEPTTRTYPFSVRYSGEDIMANLSLQERLRQDFGIDIPDLGDETNPEAYWLALSPLLTRWPRWKIRRQVTLCLLSFGKLLMYRDLIPENWPEGRSILDHGRIGELFNGVQATGDSVSATEYDLDDPAIAAHVPNLVDDADSSQHSALIDALSGRNLVVEGPPGTGKSQTITNLIAAALAQGKTVLFVSEKLAALEVVRHRLDRVGLGDFCLELHSHKTRKKTLLEDLSDRITKRHQFPAPRDLDAKLQLLEHTKRLLTAYVRLIGAPYGKLGHTLYTLLWACQRRRTTLRCQVASLERVTVDRPDELTIVDVQERSEALGHFVAHLGRVARGSPAGNHPWCGVTNAALSFLDEGDIRAAAQDFQRHSEALGQSVVALSQHLATPTDPSPEELDELLRDHASIPIDVQILWSLLAVLSAPETKNMVTGFALRAAGYRRLVADAESALRCAPRCGSDAIRRAKAALDELAAMLPAAPRVSDVRTAMGQLDNAAHQIDLLMARWADASAALQLDVALSVDVALAAAEMFATIQPLHSLEYRSPSLERPGVGLSLLRARKESRAIEELRSDLDTRIRVESAPDLATLQQYIGTISQAGWFAFLNPDYREARRAYGTLSRDAKPQWSRMRTDLVRLQDYVTRRQRLINDRDVRDAAGPHFAGLNTPWDGVCEMATWYTNLQSLAEKHGATGAHFAAQLWKARGAAIERIRTLQQADPTLSDLCRRTSDATAALRAVVPGDLLGSSNALGALRVSLQTLSQRLHDRLGDVAPVGLPEDAGVTQSSEALSQLLDADALGAGLDRDAGIAEILGPAFQGRNTNIGDIEATTALYDMVIRAPLPPAVKSALTTAASERRWHAIRAALVDASRAIDEWNSSAATFESLTKLDSRLWYRVDDKRTLPLSQILTRIRRALAAEGELGTWIEFVRARTHAVSLGLDDLLGMAESGGIEPSELDPAFNYVLLHSMAKHAFRSNPDLAKFSGLDHEQIRRQFATLDAETTRLWRQRAARMIDDRPVPAGNGVGPVAAHTELALVERECRKQRQHIPIRQLVRRAGRAIQALKPCLMMGPLSVAQYLPPGLLHFDLVVMDEASQLKPEDALGAIARAGQMVVVGDRMQLPPTSFFDRLGDEEARDEDDPGQSLIDAESILDVAGYLYRPARLLRWHYRSRHGSLIAFSNREFYGNRLVVFPSIHARSAEMGVHLVHVEDGVYGGSTNVIEARRVIDAVMEHMRARPTESLGVVALNIAQAQVLQDEFDRRLKDDHYAQEYLKKHEEGLAPFFTKNLENVQGDERDVMFVSVTYGRNERGQVFQRFGPINGPTGHRRLNVLFTRARRKIVLFSSMLAEDIQEQPGSAWGLRALKGYLAFAQTGVLEQAHFSGREPDSDFEREVADAMKRSGFDVVAQIGVAGYFIDLAVKHPRKKDAFVLGIECDGAAYHSSVSARDRDRLRDSILRDLGWKLQRIWSTDWFRNPERERLRIVQAVQDALNLERGQDSVDGHS